jgi:hypothetical protein
MKGWDKGTSKVLIMSKIFHGYLFVDFAVSFKKDLLRGIYINIPDIVVFSTPIPLYMVFQKNIFEIHISRIFLDHFAKWYVDFVRQR